MYTLKNDNQWKMLKNYERTCKIYFENAWIFILDCSEHTDRHRVSKSKVCTLKAAPPARVTHGFITGTPEIIYLSWYLTNDNDDWDSQRHLKTVWKAATMSIVKRKAFNGNIEKVTIQNCNAKTNTLIKCI